LLTYISNIKGPNQLSYIIDIRILGGNGYIVGYVYVVVKGIGWGYYAVGIKIVTVAKISNNYYIELDLEMGKYLIL
jgi:hypothetical protein